MCLCFIAKILTTISSTSLLYNAEKLFRNDLNDNRFLRGNSIS